MFSFSWYLISRILHLQVLWGVKEIANTAYLGHQIPLEYKGGEQNILTMVLPLLYGQSWNSG